MNSQLFIRFTLGASFAFLSQVAAQTIEVTSTGVGIGTATPSSLLHLFAVSPNLLVEGYGVTKAGLQIKTNGYVRWDINSPFGSSDLRFNNGSTDILTIQNSGNVGIGTTNPTRRLEVAGSITSSVAGGGTLELNGSNSNSQPSIYFERSGAGVWSTGLTADASASLYINNGYGGGNVITMTPAGNVGIGTTTPGYKLEVAGSVRATSFIANSNTYADFVFKPGYPLRSLSEVEAAIKAHGHLPDIPSEAEAKARGIDLAAMQVKLLQKVEEMTLYLVAHDKELKQLRAENAALRDEFSAREKR